MKKLFESILADLRTCASDEHGPHRPEWERSGRYPDGIVITTGWSRDPSRSNNGGEYYEYSRYRPIEDGRVIRETSSSYEDADWELKEIYGLSGEALPHLADLACQRILAENAPKPIDLVKVRRRVEDALRKTASAEDLLAIAGLLGVKVE
jgi:hypothetical protein